MIPRLLGQTVALMVTLALQPIAASQPTPLCSRIESSPLNQEVETREKRSKRIHKFLRDQSRREEMLASLPTFFNQLEDPDPQVRIEAVAHLAILRHRLKAETEKNAVRESLMALLQRETDARVVREILIHEAWTPNPTIPPFLIEAYSCETNDELRSLAVQIALKYPSMLRRLEQTGGLDARDLLEAAFERAGDEIRGTIAGLVLRSQLEPNKPTQTEDDRRNCVPYEAVLERRLPFVEKEVTRLLDDRNRPYFQHAHSHWTVAASLTEWSRHLDPDSRVALWRRVLDMAGEEPSPTDRGSRANGPARLLVQALGSRAAQSTGVDNDAALRDITEALATAPTIHHFEHHSVVDRLREIRSRIQRQRTGTLECAYVPSRYSGATYTRGFGFGGDQLSLTNDGKYTVKSWSDNIDMCHPDGRTTDGTYSCEGNTLILSPGPDMQSHGIDGDDVLTMVPWGARLFLIASSRMMDFCQWFNSGMTGWGARYYVGDQTDEAPAALPDVPPEWREYLLERPVNATVTEILESGDIALRLSDGPTPNPGMLVYGRDPATKTFLGRWEIQWVRGNEALASPSHDSTEPPPVGLRVSTSAAE